MLGTGLRIFFGLTVLTGVIYPLLVTLVAQLLWSGPANGSFITVDQKVIGSKYIGQQFIDKKYFWPRPSAINYQPIPSGASNLGPSNLKLQEQIHSRAKIITEAHPGSTFKTIPSELLYTSASGIDPDISLSTALFQLDRIAVARNFNADQKAHVIELIQDMGRNNLGHWITIPYVNVLELNIALDELR